MDQVHRIISLGGELVRFMVVLCYKRFAESLCFFRLAVRIPRSGYERAVSRGPCLGNVCRAVEAVIADNRLGHSHFTGFLYNERAFLVKTGNRDDIRIGCLDFCELRGEVGIFIRKGFCIDDFHAHFLKHFLINFIFTDHLVVVIGIHDGDLLKS